MRTYIKLILIIIIISIIVVTYFNSEISFNQHSKSNFINQVNNKSQTKLSIWISVTKVFQGVLELNIITDNTSRSIIDNVILEYIHQYHETKIMINYHDFQDVLRIVQNKIEPLKRFFQSSKGSYYSDDVFYLSPALHLVASKSVDKAIVLDIDIEFRTSICDLYDIFNNFTDSEIFGLGPELSPVYHHILWKWQYFKSQKHKLKNKVNIQGLNSGVILLFLERMRNNSSIIYNRLISPEWISHAVQKYFFKGHLGDQDWYSLVSFEYPKLIHRLSCGWNRQLCTWWKHHGYAETFNSFANCNEKIHLYHGNCDTPIPSNHLN
ncbi:xyloside xylosyltransferase 1 isoform X2 [Daktulosphaira vitifoliae]|uniref:xyloside xylosyltransferase 1 isoform X2 n=1 Tax=Daktulosphaira vitifoliae TaxID=58002 RepID=UPI0021AA7543|nr:xyloside xylosyltransferase 1 isoform X2 [Daktulosphaira vitifoliae]